MSNTIYTPYFYIIQHIESGKIYAGVKYAGDANPDNLLKSNGYQTSSKVIKNIILNEGLESFSIRKIRVFNTGEEALDYESRFLRRVNAAFNDNFLNKSNNSISTLNVDWGKSKQTCLSRFGVEYPMQSEEVREKHKQIILEKYNCESVFQLESVKEKIRQNLNIKNNRPTVLEIRKYRDKFKLNLGQNWHYKSQEFLDTLLTELKLSYDLECPRLILDSKDKTKNTLLKKYGYDNPNKVPEIKEKGILTRHNLSHRPTVLEIIKYRDKFKLNLGRNWHYKSQEFLDVLLAELKLTYDLESPRLILDSKDKKRQSRIFLSNQPIALEILKYKEKHGLKLGSYWMYKSQEFLDGILAELKITYGEISENI